MDHVFDRHRHPRQEANPPARTHGRPTARITHADPPAPPSARDVVAAHFRACARGVAAAVAQARTQRFYRASGHPWAAAL